MYQPPRLLALAFNVVIVLMMMLEALRYYRVIAGVGGLPTEFDIWLKSFCSDHEEKSGTLVTTHILLLMGCAYPFLQTYILLDGSNFPDNWVIWSLSGLVFVGIGDSAAAVGGKKFGFNKWRPQHHGKTQEGSTFLVLAIMIAEYLICSSIHDYQIYFFLCYILAAIVTSLLEAWTLSHDNLSCSMLYFGLVVTLLNLFDM